MIASAALKHLGGVITFGCLSTAGIVTLMAVIATQQEPTHAITSSMDPSRALNVESLVREAIAEGASETTTRKLVGAATELGRSFRRSV